MNKQDRAMIRLGSAIFSLLGRSGTRGAATRPAHLVKTKDQSRYEQGGGQPWFTACTAVLDLCCFPTSVLGNFRVHVWLLLHSSAAKKNCYCDPNKLKYYYYFYVLNENTYISQFFQIELSQVHVISRSHTVCHSSNVSVYIMLTFRGQSSITELCLSVLTDSPEPPSPQWGWTCRPPGRFWSSSSPPADPSPWCQSRRPAPGRLDTACFRLPPSPSQCPQN